MNAEYGAGTATLELRDQYYNMREKIEPVMHIIDTAFAAMEAVGVKPNVKPIRGGTDGAQLSLRIALSEYLCRWSEFPRSLRICAYPEYGESNESDRKNSRTGGFQIKRR